MLGTLYPEPRGVNAMLFIKAAVGVGVWDVMDKHVQSTSFNVFVSLDPLL